MEKILNQPIIAKSGKIGEQAMSRCIDADAFLKEYCEPYPHIYKAMSRAMAEAPSIDIEPKRGKWIDLSDQWGLEGTFKCSACGELWSLIDGTPQDNGMNFCPNCGADMRGKDDE